MKSALTWAACMGLAVSTLSFAQLRDNSEKQLSCNNDNYGGDRERHCEIREQIVGAVGRLNLDAGRNGGVSIKGWLRGEVLVRARVEAQADTQSAAAGLVSQVAIEASGGQVRATGPEGHDNAWWSVSYEVFVPQNTDLELKAYNGGLNVSDVRGQIHFEVNNGGVHLKRVAGDVNGSTVNGGLDVEMAGPTWEGRQLDISTRNGGVTLSVPSNFSAHLQAETESGSIQSDFPEAFAAVVEGQRRPRKIDTTIGGGGPLVHIATRNGGVHLKKLETQ